MNETTVVKRDLVLVKSVERASGEARVAWDENGTGVKVVFPTDDRGHWFLLRINFVGGLRVTAEEF